MTWRGRIALGWAALALATALALSGSVGLGQEEARTLAAARQVAGHLTRAPADPAAALSGLTAISGEPRRPLLPELLHGFLAEGGERIGLGALRGARLGAALLLALLVALLALAAFDLAGRDAAVLAPALLLLAPRLLAGALAATADVAAALLWLAALGALLRSLDAPTRRQRARAGTGAGLLAGAAAAARPDLWVLLPIFAGHWLLGRLHLWRLSRRAPALLEAPPPEPPEDWAARLRRVPTAVGAAATLGPVACAAAFPWLLADPLHRLLPALAEAHALGAPLAYPPLLLAAAALPTPLALLLGVGLVHSAQRLARALRAADGRGVRTEALLLMAALVPLALAAAGLAPRRAGLSPVAHALPVLALLGARSLAGMAQRAWPARHRALTAAVGLLVLYPGLRAVVHTFPHGASAWGEAAGGAPGAAARGWPRQDGGDAAISVLPALAARAVPGARVLWLGVEPEAVDRYRRAGLLRGDLTDAADAAGADLAVVARNGGSRDAEYVAWEALGSSRVEAGAYLDEVPLVQVFARPGAWR
jgi:dolichyl-phosphate-mannose-protein mannosyltransferase